MFRYKYVTTVCSVFLDPEVGYQKATVVVFVVIISSLKALLIRSGAQRNFAYTFVQRPAVITVARTPFRVHSTFSTCFVITIDVRQRQAITILTFAAARRAEKVLCNSASRCHAVCVCRISLGGEGNALYPIPMASSLVLVYDSLASMR